MVNIERGLKGMWSESRSLTALFLLMLMVFLLNVIGMVVDPRLITGAPAWLKPAKFSSSVAILSGTLAWMLRYLVRYKRAAKLPAAIIAVCAFLEIVVIDFQAARGVTSHFNVSTPLNSFLFGLMGAAILVLWLASVWLCVLFFRERFADRPLGWALRLGMLISVLGSITGGLMTRPSHTQLIEMQRRAPAVVGGHTVGGLDGGPGLPVVKWSTQHGDLRIPHFLGLHGLQAIPLIYFFVIRKRRVSIPQQTREVTVAAASYLALVSMLGWQALRGQSIVAPDGTTLIALGLWAGATATSLLVRPGGSPICVGGRVEAI
jgi:hypothetical protein